ncbi:hypothetical protein ASD31_22570 [Rhizobium sp. Root482]|nr:hypothetical protein ASD31_22570 [Rhizobium sp. Root482]
MILRAWSAISKATISTAWAARNSSTITPSTNGGAGSSFANVLEHKALQIFVAAFLISNIEMK